jgi:outer membrane protein assembly factor BamD (BamD/ComL family)
MGYACQKFEKYEKAKDLYEYVLSHWPEHAYAMRSQMDLAKLHLTLGDDAAGQTGVDKLLADFSRNKDIAQAVHNVAYHYQKLGKYDKAKELYEYVLSHWPDHPYAMWSQMDLAKLHLTLGDDATAQTAVDKLLADFSRNKDIAQAVHNVAYHCQKLKKYEKAKVLYQHVAANWPEHAYAMWAQMDLTKLLLTLGDDTAAQAGIDKLLADFSGNKDIAQAVHNVAYHCQSLEKYEKAKELYSYVLSHWPEDTYAMWSQADLAKLHFKLGNDADAQAAVDRLLADFSAGKDIAEAVHGIAYYGQSLGKYEKAKELYQCVLSRWPEHTYAMWSRMDLAKLEIRLGNDAAGQAALDKLTADFRNHPELPLALWRAAEGYYDRAVACRRDRLEAEAKGYFAKVINLGEKIRQQVPASAATAEAYFYSAECHYQLGEDQKALAYFQQVVAKWPDYEYAWLAQARIAKIYKRFAVGGVLPDSEVEDALDVVYEKLLANYPDCPDAQTARRWLEGKVKSSEGEQK